MAISLECSFFGPPCMLFTVCGRPTSVVIVGDAVCALWQWSLWSESTEWSTWLSAASPCSLSPRPVSADTATVYASYRHAAFTLRARGITIARSVNACHLLVYLGSGHARTGTRLSHCRSSRATISTDTTHRAVPRRQLTDWMAELIICISWWRTQRYCHKVNCNCTKSLD